MQDSALKGRGFGLAVTNLKNECAFEAAENFLSFLLLGGAAVHRCDNDSVFKGGFSRRGTFAPTRRSCPTTSLALDFNPSTNFRKPPRSW
jgi:hypothetical protein